MQLSLYIYAQVHVAPDQMPQYKYILRGPRAPLHPSLTTNARALHCIDKRERGFVTNLHLNYGPRKELHLVSRSRYIARIELDESSDCRERLLQRPSVAESTREPASSIGLSVRRWEAVLPLTSSPGPGRWVEGRL